MQLAKSELTHLSFKARGLSPLLAWRSLDLHPVCVSPENLSSGAGDRPLHQLFLP
ncbi:MAG: hypothetical protein HC899_14615 [Leptolyngbyaceae cyanobacterium SM1_4_3]|nr:hypothetical protein [Leptolyngbyaceae cyanobacterium SM1_4_3]